MQLCNISRNELIWTQTQAFKHSHAGDIWLPVWVSVSLFTDTRQKNENLSGKSTHAKWFLIQRKGQIDYFHKEERHFQCSLRLKETTHQSERLCEESDSKTFPWKSCGWVGCCFDSRGWLYHFQVRMTPICREQRAVIFERKSCDLAGIHDLLELKFLSHNFIVCMCCFCCSPSSVIQSSFFLCLCLRDLLNKECSTKPLCAEAHSPIAVVSIRDTGPVILHPTVNKQQCFPNVSGYPSH